MKNIKRPDLQSATILTALQLNKIHFSGKHTKLTPEALNDKTPTSTPVSGK